MDSLVSLAPHSQARSYAPIAQVSQVLSEEVILLVSLDFLVRLAIALLVIGLVAPPERSPRNECEGVASEVDSMPLHVARCPFCTVDLPRHRASDVPEGEDDADCRGALVRPCDVAAEPHPADRHRDEPVESCGAA